VAREHIGSAEASDNNPTSGTFPIHANAQVGDFCLCSWYASAGGGATKTFVKPAALTDIVDSSSTSYGHLYVGWKFLDAADIAAGHAGSWSSGSQTQIGTCWGTSVWRGIDADTPLDGVAYTSATGTTRFSNPPAITPATSCSAVVSVIVATKIFSYKGVLLSANGYAESFGVDNNAVGQARLTVQYIHDRAAGRLEKPEIHAEDSVDYLWTAISIVARRPDHRHLHGDLYCRRRVHVGGTRRHRDAAGRSVGWRRRRWRFGRERVLRRRRRWWRCLRQ